MPVREPHLGIGEDMPPSLPVDTDSLHHPLARLDPVGAGVHAKRATDGSRDTMEKGEAAKLLLQREGRQSLVRQRGSSPDARSVNPLCLAEALRGQPNHHAADTTVADEQI